MTETSDQPYRSKGPEDHPSPEKLAAYFENELSPTEDDAIQEHLATCDLCAQALLDLKKFLKTPAEPIRPGVADLEAASEWRDLRKRIEEDRKRGQEPVSAPAPRPGFLGSVKTAYSLAAVFAAAALGLSLYVLSTHTSYDPNSSTVFLAKSSDTRSATTPTSLVLPRGRERQVTITVNPYDLSPLQEYRVVIYDAKHQQVHREDHLIVQREGVMFTVSSDRFKEPGDYLVTLQPEGRSEGVGEYKLRVTRK